MVVACCCRLLLLLLLLLLATVVMYFLYMQFTAFAATECASCFVVTLPNSNARTSVTPPALPTCTRHSFGSAGHIAAAAVTDVVLVVVAALTAVVVVGLLLFQTVD